MHIVNFFDDIVKGVCELFFLESFLFAPFHRKRVAVMLVTVSDCTETGFRCVPKCECIREFYNGCIQHCNIIRISRIPHAIAE